MFTQGLLDTKNRQAQKYSEDKKVVQTNTAFGFQGKKNQLLPFQSCKGLKKCFMPHIYIPLYEAEITYNHGGGWVHPKQPKMSKKVSIAVPIAVVVACFQKQ